MHFRQLIKQSQSEGEAIGRSLTNTFKTRFKKIMDSSQVILMILNILHTMVITEVSSFRTPVTPSH